MCVNSWPKINEITPGCTPTVNVSQHYCKPFDLFGITNHRAGFRWHLNCVPARIMTAGPRNGLSHFLGAQELSSAAFRPTLTTGNKQEAFEKCWAHSPLRAAARPFTRCHCRRRLRIDVHDDNANDNNDNA